MDYVDQRLAALALELALMDLSVESFAAFPPA